MFLQRFAAQWLLARWCRYRGRQCGENQSNIGAARDVIRNDERRSAQSTKILAASDARVAENLRGRPDERIVDRKPQPANWFSLRPARIRVFAAPCRGLLQARSTSANGLRIGEGGFVEFHVKLFLQGAKQWYKGGSQGGSRLEQELTPILRSNRVELLSALEEKFHVETQRNLLRQCEDRCRRRARPARARGTAAANTRIRAGRSENQFAGCGLRSTYALVWPATQILGHPRITGRENLRGLRGPALIVSNHITRRADIGTDSRRIAAAITDTTLPQPWAANRCRTCGTHHTNGSSPGAGPINSASGSRPCSSTFSHCRGCPASARAFRFAGESG